MTTPKPMTEAQLARFEQLADQGENVDPMGTRELVAEVRRLQTLVYGKTVSLVTTIQGGQVATYEPSLAEQAASDLEERRYWEARYIETRDKLAVAREALGWYADKIHYDEEFGCGAWVKPDTFEEDGGYRARAALAKLEAPADGK